MRRALIIGGGLVGLIILIAALMLAYAVLNLNSIIQERRGYILSRVSDAIGRPVMVETIQASLGWGVLIDLSGVQVADDHSFSSLPMIEARDVYLKVEFIPLLFHQARVIELRVNHPIIHVVRDRAGELNFEALARRRVAPLPLPPNLAGAKPNETPAAPNANPLTFAQPVSNRPTAAIFIRRFALTDGVVDYTDQSTPNHAPIELRDLEISVGNFSLRSQFEFDLGFAAFGDQKNFDLNGTIGPLANDGALDLKAVPLRLKAAIGPLTLGQVRTIPALAKTLPAPLAITGPLNASATAIGTADAINFTISGDLSPNQIFWQPSFDKPAGTPLTLEAAGSRTSARLILSSIDVALAGAKAHFTQVNLKPDHLGSHITTNDFAIGPVAAMIPAAAKYHPNGTASLDALVAIGAGHHAILNGNAALSDIGLTILKRGAAVPITHLSGPIQLGGNTAHIGPLTFNLGSAHARLDALAQSLQPPRINYRFQADKLMLTEIIPSRRELPPEYLNDFVANGNAALAESVGATVNAAATSGLIQNVPFTNLAIDAAYVPDRISLNSFAFDSCDGAISGKGTAMLGAIPAFDLTIATRGLNLQKAMSAVKAKAANTVRGGLTANLSLSGHGEDFDRARPTLRGNGHAEIVNAKLVGVNVPAQALRKIDNLPAIGTLVPASVIRNHPELFASPDTDIQSASLTFVIFGPRLTTHDFSAQAIDYNVMADGWFDLDKNLDMNAQILLSQPFSSELIAARKNVAFLADHRGQVVIPLRVTGRLPHPSVMPNVDILAQRAASNAMQSKLGGLIDKGGKGLGGIFKHGNPLQGFFH
jgi:hypothetical protein